MLEAEKWNKAKEIFQAALVLPAAEREEFVERESNDDRIIKREVETLLEAFDEAGTFIVAPVASLADFVESAQTASIVGRQIGAYQILREIGRGGMGAVYLAQRADREFQKKVALKLIKRGFDTDEIVRHFRNERQILANLEHPNIARLLDGGATEDGLPFLVMEYVEGVKLTHFCDENNLEIVARLELFLAVCAAVSHAHRNLIVHRDLKPSNILVTNEGIPKLLDFGIAKLLTPTADFATGQTATNFNVMTPEYASPEQVRGESVTTATDVYSLGVILFELLTGLRPYQFETRSQEEIVRTICEFETIRPSSAISRNLKKKSESAKPTSKFGFRSSNFLRGDLDNIILMAMRKEPERRYSSVEQFAEDIRRYLKDLPVLAREDAFGYRASKFIGRNKIGIAAAGGIALSLVAGIVGARRQRDKAERINRFLQKMLASADPRAAGKDAKVVEVLQFAADSIKKDFAGQPEIVADLSTTIGLTFLNLGQIDSAEFYLTEALEIRRALFGLKNFVTGMSLNNYGRLVQAKGDLKKAENFFRQALMILRRVRRTHALDLAAVLGNLGYLLMLEAKYDEAIDTHREELALLRVKLSENHAEFARTLGNLANVFSVLGDKKTAEPMHRQALAVTQRFYGGEHPDVALAMLHLAITLASSKSDEAETLFSQSLALRRKFFGNEHTETAWALYYLGDMRIRKKDYDRAAGYAREILSCRGRSISESHSVIHSALLMLARCYLGNNQPLEAEKLLRECLKLRQETLPPGHWLIATTNGYLAECFLQTERFNEAVPLLEENYKTLLSRFGANHEHTKQAQERLKNCRALILI
ncbi:MAG TPA: serine/threonine-protein kinase [Pyrinomonadaceae bacterium]|jgi:serine/threonine-protein kinase